MVPNREPDAGVAHPVERHLAKVEVASSSLVTRSKNQERTHAFLICIWYRSQVVRPRSAKPLFASSNLAGTSKKSFMRQHGGFLTIHYSLFTFH